MTGTDENIETWRLLVVEICDKFNLDINLPEDNLHACEIVGCCLVGVNRELEERKRRDDIVQQAWKLYEDVENNAHELRECKNSIKMALIMDDPLAKKEQLSVLKDNLFKSRTVFNYYLLSWNLKQDFRTGKIEYTSK